MLAHSFQFSTGLALGDENCDDHDDDVTNSAGDDNDLIVDGGDGTTVVKMLTTARASFSAFESSAICWSLSFDILDIPLMVNVLRNMGLMINGATKIAKTHVIKLPLARARMGIWAHSQWNRGRGSETVDL